MRRRTVVVQGLFVALSPPSKSASRETSHQDCERSDAVRGACSCRSNHATSRSTARSAITTGDVDPRCDRYVDSPDVARRDRLDRIVSAKRAPTSEERNALIADAPAHTMGAIRRRPRVGGLLNYYERAAGGRLSAGT